MSTEDASLRQDVIENAVQHQVVLFDQTVTTEQALDAAFASGLKYDLAIWPREYLETYLDSDDGGSDSVERGQTAGPPWSVPTSPKLVVAAMQFRSEDLKSNTASRIENARA